MKLPKCLTEPSNLVSFPARVQNYLDAQMGKTDADYLLPVSCRLKVVNQLSDIFKSMIWIKQGAGVKLILPSEYPTVSNTDTHKLIKAQDSLLTDDLPGDMGIYDSFISKCHNGDDIDFSLLRPKGSPCRGGLKASGRESFEAIDSALDAYRFNPNMYHLLYLIGLINDVMIRGGYNRGIIIVSYPASGEHLEEFLNVDLGKIPGSLKREVRFQENEKGLNELAGLTEQQRSLIAETRQFSSLLLAKESSDSKGNKLYTNVCEGIYLKDEDSCLIVRVPLGRLSLPDIVPAYKEAFKAGKALWRYWHSKADKVPHSGNPSEVDRQIAIDPFGLANMLAYYEIPYREFVAALKWVNDHWEKTYREKLPWEPKKPRVTYPKPASFAAKLAIELHKAHHEVAKLNNGFFERIFTVEPSQSHAFREKDRSGYTFARGIWAVWDKYLQTDSDRNGSQIYEYPSFETIKDQDDFVQIQEDISKEWYRMMASTNLAHAISHDTYYYFDKDRLVDWLLYGLPSLYYNFYQESHQVVAKTVQEISLDGIDLTPTCDPTVGFCQICGA